MYNSKDAESYGMLELLTTFTTRFEIYSEECVVQLYKFVKEYYKSEPELYRVVDEFLDNLFTTTRMN